MDKHELLIGLTQVLLRTFCILCATDKADLEQATLSLAKETKRIEPQYAKSTLSLYLYCYPLRIDKQAFIHDSFSGYKWYLLTPIIDTDSGASAPELKSVVYDTRYITFVDTMAAHESTAW